MENQTPVTPVNQKTSNFLIILLSILLFISVVIAGFFAYQTQKLVNELNVLRNQPNPVATTEPTAEPFVADSTSIPMSVSNLFDSINKKFKLNLVPVEENQFYSPSGLIGKKSWKIDLNSSNLGKSFTTYLLTLLSPVYAESGGIGGGGVDAYENTVLKCFHVYGYRGGDPSNWKDPYNYLTCTEK